MDRCIGQAKIGADLLAYYNRNLPPDIVLGLGEGYCYHLEKSDGIYQFYHQTDNFAPQVFENLCFFMNHNVSDGFEDFLNEVEDMLFVKKYPIGIFFREVIKNTREVFERGKLNLLVKGKGKERSFLCHDGMESEKEFTKSEMCNSFSFKQVEWYVVIPPKRSLNVNKALIKSLNNIVEKMLYGRENTGIQAIRKWKDGIMAGEISHSNMRITEMDGCVCDLFAELLKTAGTRLKEQSFIELSLEYTKLACEWTKFYTMYSTQPDELQQLTKVLEEIYEKEKCNIHNLEKILDTVF